MRTTRFRVWDKKNKCMNDGGFWLGAATGRIALVAQQTATGMNVLLDNDIDHDNYVLMESTGLKDKNDKEFCGADIISFTVFDHNGLDAQFIGLIVWDKEDAAWNIQCESETFGLGEVLRQDDEVEIIGNVHSNPELLEAKE